MIWPLAGIALPAALYGWLSIRRPDCDGTVTISVAAFVAGAVLAAEAVIGAVLLIL